MRDIKQAYRAAMIDEYAALKASGRDEEAEHVATVLAERYDHKVDGRKKPPESTDKPESSDTPETTAADPAPEAAVPPAPRRGRPPKTAGR